MERALYGPDGFYQRGGRAGREGDFLTAVEVGPLFGEVTARALERWWDELGRPDPFVVVEGGAGRGQWCRMVRAAVPSCGHALRWIAVERAEPLRAEAAGAADAVHADLPRLEAHVVLANELLDNLPFRVLERTEEGWDELFVDDGVERWRPARTDDVAQLTSGLTGVAPGSRVPVQEAARQWVEQARAVLAPGGRLVCFDYCSTTAELAARAWTEWVRTYRGHGRGGTPWTDPGSQDITCEVCWDQLPAGGAVCDQASWLRAYGLDELVAEGRQVWAERAHLGDLAAVKARSRVSEAAALTDPAGMGRFTVLTWRSVAPG